MGGGFGTGKDGHKVARGKVATCSSAAPNACWTQCKNVSLPVPEHLRVVQNERLDFICLFLPLF